MVVMGNAKNKTNKSCSRCHVSGAISSYTLDDAICDDCIKIKPRGHQRKDKRVLDPDLVKFADCWGTSGLYN